MNRVFVENVPGIPRSPAVQFYHVVQYSYERTKSRYSTRIPFLSQDEILKHRNPQTYLFQQLLASGYNDVVTEILNLKHEQETHAKLCGGGKTQSQNEESSPPSSNLMTNQELLKQVVDTLKLCLNQEMKGNYLSAARLRFQLAEDLINKQDYLLAKHFLLTALATTHFTPQGDKEEFQSKLHCFLAFVGTKLQDEDAETVIKHLEKTRALSKGRHWGFKAKTLQIQVQRPISIFGLTDESQVFTCSGLTVYKASTFLYYDVLSKMITDTMTMATAMNGSQAKRKGDYDVALNLAGEVVEMAKEIRNPVATAAALTRYGILLRQFGCFNEALLLFQQLCDESEFDNDFESLAVAYANLGICYQGRRFPLEALTFFQIQNEVAHLRNYFDIQADAIVRISGLLLEEGQTLEAEQAIFEAYIEFNENNKRKNNSKKSGTRSKHQNNSIKDKEKQEEEQKSEERSDQLEGHSWVMSGVVSGQNLWGRYAGLCRLNEESSTESVLQWKEMRQPLKQVPRPSYETPALHSIFSKIDPQKKIPDDDCAWDYNCFKTSYREYENNLKLFELINKPQLPPVLAPRGSKDAGKNRKTSLPSSLGKHRGYHRTDHISIASSDPESEFESLLEEEEEGASFHSGSTKGSKESKGSKGQRRVHHHLSSDHRRHSHDSEHGHEHEHEHGHGRGHKHSSNSKHSDILNEYDSYLMLNPHSSVALDVSSGYTFASDGGRSSILSGLNNMSGGKHMKTKAVKSGPRRILAYALGSTRNSDATIMGNHLEYTASRTTDQISEMAKKSAVWLSSKRDIKGQFDKPMMSSSVSGQKLKPLNLSFGSAGSKSHRTVSGHSHSQVHHQSQSQMHLHSTHSPHSQHAFQNREHSNPSNHNIVAHSHSHHTLHHGSHHSTHHLQTQNNSLKPGADNVKNSIIQTATPSKFRKATAPIPVPASTVTTSAKSKTSSSKSKTKSKK